MMIKKVEVIALIGDNPTADKVVQHFTIRSIVDFVQHRQGGA